MKKIADAQRILHAWVQTGFRPSVHLHLGLAAGVMLMASPAQAAFHLWSVTEIYSSADGSVQYVKLATASTLENSVGGHAITCSGPAGTHSFTIPGNLSSSATAGKTFLIGTPNLGTIPGGVTPDYFFTNTTPFLFINGGGTTSVGITGSFQAPATYTTLPTDGLNAANSTGGSVLNAPKNFSDQSNSIVPVKFSSAMTVGTNFLMGFRTATGTNGTAGPNYTVDYKNSPTDLNWTPLATVAGNGTTKTVTNALSTANQRFFRLHAP